MSWVSKFALGEHICETVQSPLFRVSQASWLQISKLCVSPNLNLFFSVVFFNQIHFKTSPSCNALEILPTMIRWDQDKRPYSEMSHEKYPLTFSYTDWLIWILIMAFCNPYKIQNWVVLYIQPMTPAIQGSNPSIAGSNDTMVSAKGPWRQSA